MYRLFEQDLLADEAAELDGYFSDTPLEIDESNFPELRTSMETAILLQIYPKLGKPSWKSWPESSTNSWLRLVPSKPIQKRACRDSWCPTYDKEEKGSTLGLCLAEFCTAEQAQKAAILLYEYDFW